MQNFFKNKKGKTVIAQKPNLPIIIWFISFSLLYLPLNREVATLISYISFGAIFTWAWMEIFLGANMFRRSLGIIVMLFILIQKII